MPPVTLKRLQCRPCHQDMRHHSDEEVGVKRTWNVKSNICDETMKSAHLDEDCGVRERVVERE